MCSVQYWRSRQCGHQWFTIKKSCSPGAGFDNCPSFYGRGYRYPKGPGLLGPCPWDDLKGAYDSNTTRVISSVTHGIKFARDVDRRSPGVEVVCCSVM